MQTLPFDFDSVVEEPASKGFVLHGEAIVIDDDDCPKSLTPDSGATCCPCSECQLGMPSMCSIGQDRQRTPEELQELLLVIGAKSTPPDSVPDSVLAKAQKELELASAILEGIPEPIPADQAKAEIMECILADQQLADCNPAADADYRCGIEENPVVDENDHRKPNGGDNTRTTNEPETELAADKVADRVGETGDLVNDTKAEQVLETENAEAPKTEGTDFLESEDAFKTEEIAKTGEMLETKEVGACSTADKSSKPVADLADVSPPLVLRHHQLGKRKPGEEEGDNKDADQDLDSLAANPADDMEEEPGQRKTKTPRAKAKAMAKGEPKPKAKRAPRKRRQTDEPKISEPKQRRTSKAAPVSKEHSTTDDKTAEAMEIDKAEINLEKMPDNATAALDTDQDKHEPTPETEKKPLSRKSRSKKVAVEGAVGKNQKAEPKKEKDSWVSWAGRYMPQDNFKALKFRAIRDVYMRVVAPQVKAQSKHQDCLIPVIRGWMLGVFTCVIINQNTL